MKKLLMFIISCVVLVSVSQGTFAMDKIKNVTTFSSKDLSENRVWVGTFQLVWNDFVNEIIKKPVKFINGDQSVVKILNKQEFTSDMLSEDSYYKTYGVTSLALKKEIEDALVEKFGEKSEILDQIDWEADNNAYFLYAMLKKDFDFVNKFNQLSAGSFGPYNARYFGIDDSSKEPIYDNVSVLFYNSSSDFAVMLKTKSNDEVYLYRTNENKPFNVLYKAMNKNAAKYKGNKNFIEGDKIKIPYVSFKNEANYDDLCNRIIKNTDNLYFAKALQTVDFKLNETGVKLKSEAALDVKFMSFLPTQPKVGRNFSFDNVFVIFLKEKNKQMPYFAARIKDLILFGSGIEE